MKILVALIAAFSLVALAAQSRGLCDPDAGCMNDAFHEFCGEGCDFRLGDFTGNTAIFLPVLEGVADESMLAQDAADYCLPDGLNRGICDKLLWLDDGEWKHLLGYCDPYLAEAGLEFVENFQPVYFHHPIDEIDPEIGAVTPIYKIWQLDADMSIANLNLPRGEMIPLPNGFCP